MSTIAKKENYRATKFSDFHDFCIILYLIAQRVFIVKTCARKRWTVLLMSKFLILGYSFHFSRDLDDITVLQQQEIGLVISVVTNLDIPPQFTIRFYAATRCVFFQKVARTLNDE
jgi:hypothetical protein